MSPVSTSALPEQTNHDRAATAKLPSVDYPNRSLGMRYARSNEDAAHDTSAWANVALSNLLPGERLYFGNETCAVHAISDDALTLKKPNGKRKRIGMPSATMDTLVRDVGGRLSGLCFGIPAIDDTTGALFRDPAFHCQPGCAPYLKDI